MPYISSYILTYPYAYIPLIICSHTTLLSQYISICLPIYPSIYLSLPLSPMFLYISLDQPLYPHICLHVFLQRPRVYLSAIARYGARFALCFQPGWTVGYLELREPKELPKLWGSGSLDEFQKLRFRVLRLGLRVQGAGLKGEVTGFGCVISGYLGMVIL